MNPLIVLVALAGSGSEEESWVQALRRLERERTELETLRRSLQAGAEDRARISLLVKGAPDRLRLLERCDLRGARRLGIGPAELRARFLSGFEQELRDLDGLDPRSASEGRGSSVLQRLLDLEEELHARALARLHRMGLPEPRALATSKIDAPAPRPLDPEVPPPPASEKGREPVRPPADPDRLALVAATSYASGDWGRALEAYQALAPTLMESNLEDHYRIADCLMKLSDPARAATAFESLAEAYPESRWGRSAEWNAKIARSLALLEKRGER